MGGVGGAILCAGFSSLCFVYGLAWAGTNWSGAPGYSAEILGIQP